MKSNSFYLKDSTERDGRVETIIDYTLSWTLRRAQEKFRNEKPILFKYCREILAKLLGMACNEDLLFLSVDTLKQEFRIDLWVKVTLSANGVIQEHAILIEDKLYSRLGHIVDEDGVSRIQIEVYKKKFDDYYKNNNADCIKHYLLITAIDSDDEKFKIYDEAKDYGFEVHCLGDIHSVESEDSESDIFNEFWCRHW